MASTEEYDHLYKNATVGKTHLLSRYIRGTLPKTPQSTIGVEFATRTVPLQIGGTVKAQIWDTAGQERYRSITSAHYRRAVGALLVYDVTRKATFVNVAKVKVMPWSPVCVCQWLDDLRQNGEPDIVVLLVGNKVDLVEDDPSAREVPYATAAQYAQRNGLFFSEASAVSSFNVKHIFEYLLQEIYNQKAQDRNKGLARSPSASVAAESQRSGGIQLAPANTGGWDGKVQSTNDKVPSVIRRHAWHDVADFMVLIEKPPFLHFRTVEAVVAVDFQPHPVSVEAGKPGDAQPGHDPRWKNIERLAAAAGSVVNIWALSFREELCDKPTPDTPETQQHNTPGSDCMIWSRCVYTIKEHAPHYLVALQWSPSGTLLASCDSRQIVISEFVRFAGTCPDGHGLCCSGELWKTCIKMTDPSFDLFDLCWTGEDKLITGGVDGMKIWSLHEQNVTATVRFTEGFVKGVRAYGTTFVAVQSNDRRAFVWRHHTEDDDGPLMSSSVPHAVVTAAKAPAASSFPGFLPYVEETEVLTLAPMDIPYYRRPSFDRTGRVVAFPYGERSNQCFGFAFMLDERNGEAPDTVPFRFRGHASRVNCVAFSRGLWTEKTGSSVKEGGDGGGLGSGRRFTLYAQASLDGALSVWKFYYPQQSRETSAARPHSRSDSTGHSNEEERPLGGTTPGPFATCILVLKPRFLDEQASVTDLSWTSDGTCLVVGADDGSLTFIAFTLNEIGGHPVTNVKQWARIASLPSPPLRLPATKHPDQLREAPQQHVLMTVSTTTHALQPSADNDTTHLLAHSEGGGGGSASHAPRRRITPIVVSSSVQDGL